MLIQQGEGRDGRALPRSSPKTRSSVEVSATWLLASEALSQAASVIIVGCSCLSASISALNPCSNRAAPDEIIAGAFSTMTRDEVVDLLKSARIAYGRVSTIEDLAAHPQNRFINVETPAGPVRMLAPGATHDGLSLAAGRTPSIGEHDIELRREFENSYISKSRSSM